MSDHGICLALTTMPDEAGARGLAHALVQAKLAACVHLREVHSVYRWQGNVESGVEWQLSIKTTRASWPALQGFVRERHPYELPELLCLDVSDGEVGYLAWVRENCI